MDSLTTQRRRLLAFFKEVATLDGGPDLAAVATLRGAGERRAALREILSQGALDYSDLLARLDADPDLSSLSRCRRLEALIDYARLAIGLIDRELTAHRGHLIVSSNDD
jgi:hypothetical protein